MALLLISQALAGCERVGTSKPWPSVEDRLAILDVMARYVHAIDAADGAALGALFAPEAVWSDGTRTLRGPMAIADTLTAPRTDGTRPIHYFDAVLLTLATDGAVRAQSRTLTCVDDPTKRGFHPLACAAGFYDDLFVQTPSGWRFQSRHWGAEPPRGSVKDAPNQQSR